MTQPSSSKRIEEDDVTIVRHDGEVKRAYWTVEVSTRFTKKEAEKFYNYIALYHMTQGVSKQ